MRIIVAVGGGGVVALLGTARVAVDEDAGRIVGALLGVGVAEGAADGASSSSGNVSADGAEESASTFGGDSAALLLAAVHDPHARIGGGTLSTVGLAELLASGDALGGAGEPGAAVAFGGTFGLADDVPARALTLVSVGIPRAHVRLDGGAAGVRVAGAGLGAAASVVVVPLAVGVR